MDSFTERMGAYFIYLFWTELILVHLASFTISSLCRTYSLHYNQSAWMECWQNCPQFILRHIKVFCKYRHGYFNIPSFVTFIQYYFWINQSHKFTEYQFTITIKDLHHLWRNSHINLFIIFNHINFNLMLISIINMRQN